MLQKKDEKGFSLIELMVVVVIIGILASVSIPAYINHVRRARIAEAKANLGSIKILQESYRAVNDTYLACTAHPVAGVPGDTEGDWGGGNTGFNAIGFTPSGGIWFQYVVAADADSFTATATGDMDGDTTPAIITITNNEGIDGPDDGVY